MGGCRGEPQPTLAGGWRPRAAGARGRGEGCLVSDAVSLWRKALAIWLPLQHAEAAGFCVSTEPFLPEIAARARHLALWDWRQSALAACALGAQPWGGDPADLPPASVDIALLDLETLHGRASFEQAARGAAAVLRPRGTLLLRGGNANGVGGAARRLRDWFGGVEALAYGGGHRVLAAVRGERTALPGPPAVAWEHAELGGAVLRVRRTPGVFAEGLVDAGTGLLAEAATALAPGRRVCDLGCGTGLLGLALLARGASTCAFCDEDLRALAALRANLAANTLPPAASTEVQAVDATMGVPGGPYDLVVCNPPFHQGIAVSHALSEAVVRAGWRALAPGGTMLVVGMRFLPLDRWLSGAEEVAGDRAYRVLAATRPRDAARERRGRGWPYAPSEVKGTRRRGGRGRRSQREGAARARDDADRV